MVKNPYRLAHQCPDGNLEYPVYTLRWHDIWDSAVCYVFWMILWRKLLVQCSNKKSKSKYGASFLTAGLMDPCYFYTRSTPKHCQIIHLCLQRSTQKSWVLLELHYSGKNHGSFEIINSICPHSTQQKSWTHQDPFMMHEDQIHMNT